MTIRHNVTSHPPPSTNPWGFKGEPHILTPILGLGIAKEIGFGSICDSEWLQWTSKVVKNGVLLVSEITPPNSPEILKIAYSCSLSPPKPHPIPLTTSPLHPCSSALARGREWKPYIHLTLPFLWSPLPILLFLVAWSGSCMQ